MKQLIILFLLIFSLSYSQLPKVHANYPLKLWVITDIHYLSPSLHDQTGDAIEHIRNTGAGKEFDYGGHRMAALIHHIKSEQPDALIISGDLTLNGEYQSMVDLADYFDRIEQLGTRVWVIPGNHDISSGWAREFQGEKFIHTEQVLPEDFKQLFSNHGYDEALFYDKHSLSYLAPLSETIQVLMIDSNVYSQTKGKGAPPTNGRLKKETLQWIDDCLDQAANEGKKVIPVMHHNAITHFSRLEKNYTLDNAVDYREILFKHNIPITLSGHIHVQHIQTLQEAGNQLTDIVTGAFSSYPSYIGKFSITSSTIDYDTEPLPMSTWVQSLDTDDPQLQDYDLYMREVFMKSSRQMAFREMIEGGWYDKNDPVMEEIADYVGLVNLAFFSGKPLEFYDLTVFDNLELIRTLINQNAGQFFKSYIQDIEQGQNDHTHISINW